MNRIVHLILALGAVGLLAILLALTVSVQPSAHAAGNIIKVPDDYATIQAAIDAASDGDTILVAEGLYKENLSITEGITLSGGWNISFTARIPGYSIVDAQGLGRVISITCVSSDTVVTIDGFTIERGNATGLGGPPLALGEEDWLQGVSQPAAPAPDDHTPAERVADLRSRLADLTARGLYPGGEAAYQATLARLDRLIAQAGAAPTRPRPAATADAALQAGDCGGGVYSWNTSLHLLNSTLLYNLASLTGDGYGGGVFVGQAPSGGVLIANNTLEGNIASAAVGAEGIGGGLYVIQAPGVVIKDNTFQENAGSSGGVVSIGVGGGLVVDTCPNATVRGNHVTRNTANAGWETMRGLGGGAYLREVDDATVTDNVFQENLGVLYGGGGSGGLILVRSQDVLVADNTATGNWGCVFQPDLTDVSGGGFSLHTVWAVTVTGNTLSDNVACLSGPRAGNSFGGGVDAQLLFNSTIASNTITGNVACQTGIGWGGGISIWAGEDSVVADNTLTDNAGSLSGLGGGGGVFLRNTVGMLVQHNRIQGNRGTGEGDGSGGGLRVEGQGPYSFDTTVDANLFLDNRACVTNPSEPSIGGACVVGTDGFTFTNNVVAGNSADLAGGLYLPFAQGGVVTNNTLAGNSDAAILVDQWNITPITLTNNIVVSHTVGISVTEGATATVRYTLWHGNDTDIGGGGVISHTHPVTGVPAFKNPAAGDYHIGVGSAAVNAGDPAGVPPAPPVDRDGVARPQGLAVDLGAYEWRGHWWYLPLMFKSWRAYVGWAVGDSADGYGTILHTTDGGASWVRQGSAADVPNIGLQEVSAVDNQNAWVVGAQVILRTRDGGQTWETQTLPADLPTGFELMSVKAIDRNTAWVVGTLDVLLGTTDGQTWNIMPRSADLHLALPVHYSGVDAADATHVWAVGSFGPGDRGNPVIAFYDGTQWRRQGAGAILSGHSAALIGVSALNQDTVWAVGGADMTTPFPLVKTTDGGATWQQVGPPAIPGMDTNRVVVVTADVGWVSGDDGNVVYTTDAGATWYHVNVPSAFLFGVTATDDKTAWVVGPGLGVTPPGIIAHTSDAQHWEVQSDPSWPNMNGISFVGARR